MSDDLVTRLQRDKWHVSAQDLEDAIAALEAKDREIAEVIQQRDAYLPEMRRLRAENEALRRDAERYRWLRQQHWNGALLAVVVNPKAAVRLGHDCPRLERLDVAIDAAMKRGEKDA